MISRNSTKRPAVAWLDDEIEIYADYIANLSLNGYICFPCKKVGELLKLLMSDDRIDAIILDLVLAGNEDGEDFIKTLQLLYPSKALIIFSAKTTSHPASEQNPVNRLRKPLTPENIDFGQPDNLIKSIENAQKFARSDQKPMQTLSLRDKFIRLPWDFLFGLFMPIRRPALAAIVLFFGAIQILTAVSVGEEGGAATPYLPVALEILETQWSVLFAVLFSTIGYLCFCPPDIRGITSRQAFDDKWRSKYVINPADQAKIDSALKLPASPVLDELNSRFRVNAYFEHLRIDRPISRYVVATSMGASFTVYVLSGASGFLQLFG